LASATIRKCILRAFSGGTVARTFVSILFVVLSGPCAVSLAVADDLLGLYVGAAFGESHLRSEKYVPGDTDYSALLEGHHSAWDVAAGVRPFQPLGLEMQYIDFGKLRAGAGSIGGQGGISAVDAKAGTLSALGYLPLPVPFLDVYGKVGIARLRETTSEIGPVLYCPVGFISCGRGTSSISNWSTNFAYGAGFLGKIGSLSIRAEYERLSASGENPSIASLGGTWTF
jgi:opacity protein-like surface antigen